MGIKIQKDPHFLIKKYFYKSILFSFFYFFSINDSGKISPALYLQTIRLFYKIHVNKNKKKLCTLYTEQQIQIDLFYIIDGIILNLVLNVR